MQRNPSKPIFPTKYPTKQTPGEGIKLFFTRTPLRRELEASLDRGCRNKSHIQKITKKDQVTKDFCNRTLTSSRLIESTRSTAPLQFPLFAAVDK